MKKTSSEPMQTSLRNIAALALLFTAILSACKPREEPTSAAPAATAAIAATAATAATAAPAVTESTSHAQGAPMCALIKPADIEAVLGAQLASKEEWKGVFSVACNYETVAGRSPGPGWLSLERYTIDIPRGGERDVLTYSGKDKDNYNVVPGLGDLALIDEDSWDMALRKGNTVYHYTTGGVPCETNAQPSAEEDKQCHQKRMNALIQISHLILAAG